MTRKTFFNELKNKIAGMLSTDSEKYRIAILGDNPQECKIAMRNHPVDMYYVKRRKTPTDGWLSMLKATA